MNGFETTSDSDVQAALEFLAANWRHDPNLRAAFDSILAKLKNGSTEDIGNALLLEKYLEFPGSDQALNVSTSLFAAIQTKEGRKAAKLPPNTRGSIYTAKLVKYTDQVMVELIKNEMGEKNAKEVEIKAIEFLGAHCDRKTIKKFIDELRPRAKQGAIFFATLQNAYSDKLSL